VRLRKKIEGEWLLMLAGIVSIVFGVFVFIFPAAGALALVWLISLQVILIGILYLTFAVRARSWKPQADRGAMPAPKAG